MIPCLPCKLCPVYQLQRPLHRLSLFGDNNPLQADKNEHISVRLFGHTPVTLVMQCNFCLARHHEKSQESICGKFTAICYRYMEKTLKMLETLFHWKRESMIARMIKVLVNIIYWSELKYHAKLEYNSCFHHTSIITPVPI